MYCSSPKDDTFFLVDTVHNDKPSICYKILMSAIHGTVEMHCGGFQPRSCLLELKLNSHHHRVFNMKSPLCTSKTIVSLFVISKDGNLGFCVYVCMYIHKCVDTLV